LGLTQGDALSHILFSIELGKVVCSGIETTGTTNNKTIQILAYILLVGRTRGVLKGAIISLSKAAKEMVLIINLGKKKKKKSNVAVSEHGRRDFT
jgi:hypothetical protein